MVDLVTAVALLLLVGGVAGSVLPLVPSGLLSLSGVVLYYVAADPAPGDEMSLLLLIVFVIVGVLTAALEQLGGAIASKAGGAETTTMIAAAVASLVLFFVLGPLGIVVGTAAVVLAAELRAGKESEAAARTALWTVAGILGSSVAQLALTLSMLVGFVLFVLVL